MPIAFILPRLLIGPGTRFDLETELRAMGVVRPLLLADAGVGRAGVLALVAATLAAPPVLFTAIPENPTIEAADAALEVFRAHGCDGVVAVGGGSVLDAGKMIAAAAASTDSVGHLVGRPERIAAVVPLVAVPTTCGTGSESSPVAALHGFEHGYAIGTRSASLVPRLAICDSDLVRSLPPRLVAATAIDAMSHCIEGYFAEPAHPLIDALALDGIGRVFAEVKAAMLPSGDAARGSLMAAAFFGGAAIHKGLGPAHAFALACGDQAVHHGTLIGIVLPRVMDLVGSRVPIKAARIAAAMGLAAGADPAAAVAGLIASLGLPVTLGDIGFVPGDPAERVLAMATSHFNRTSPFAPDERDYSALLIELA